MKNIVIKSILSTALLATAGISFAQSGSGNAFGVVISATPVVQQVTVPKQVCTTSTVHSYQPSGGGALLGAVVGGALGNQFGRGSGQDNRAVATVIGALGGGIVGNQIEAQNYPTYPAQYPTQSCHTQNVVENRTVAQNVLYEYAGQRYTVQMPASGDFRPGVRIALQVPQATYVPPVQTVTYVQPAPTVVYYDTHDAYRPRYIYSSVRFHTPHYDTRHYGVRYDDARHHNVRTVTAPIQVVRHPVHPAHPGHRGVHHGTHRGYHHDDHRNWR
jgi:uncharacterized protein YcfJ